MTRDEMIAVLTEDRLTEWVFSGHYSSLEEVLFYGWKGYKFYTDKELGETIEELFDPEQVKDYIESRRRRLEKRVEKDK